MMPATCVPWPLSSYGERAAVDEVDEREHAAVGQVGMLIRGDAGVDEGDRHAGARIGIEVRAVDPVAQVDGVGVHRDRRQRVVLVRRTVDVHAVDAAAVGERGQQLRRHLIEHVAVDHRQLAVVRVALEGVRQVGAVLERDDHVGGCRDDRWPLARRATSLSILSRLTNPLGTPGRTFVV